MRDYSIEKRIQQIAQQAIELQSRAENLRQELEQLLIKIRQDEKQRPFAPWPGFRYRLLPRQSERTH